MSSEKIDNATGSDNNEEFDALAAQALEDAAAEKAEFDKLNIQALKSVSTKLPMVWTAPPKPVILKARDGIKRKRQVEFLKALAEIGTISLACKAIGINTATEHKWRVECDPWYDEQFKYHLQIYRDTVQAEVHDRAIHGVDVPIVGKKQVQVGKDIDGNPIFGQEDRIIGTKKVKSDLLLMFHAKRVIPEYRDKYEPPKEDTKPHSTDSPMVRITMRLDMISGRQQGQIAGKPQLRIVSGKEAAPDDDAIEITPETVSEQ